MFARGEIEALARSVGFDACGVAHAEALTEDAAYLKQWLAAGCAGTMAYMAAHQDLRTDPQQLVPDTQTVVVCLLNYYKSEKQQTDAPLIAQCGLSREDYHEVMKSKLQALEEHLLQTHPQCINPDYQHLFCDSAPILERRWAVRAGLGWIGRNHLLIHPQLGSFVHIGILLLREPCEAYAIPLERDCGACDACLKACPTGAFREGMFDARRCVSYLTIERREPLEAQYKAIVAQSLYGCDRCQNACPYNQHLTPTPHPELMASPQLLTLTADDWQRLSRRQKLKLLRRLAKDE